MMHTGCRDGKMAEVVARSKVERGIGHHSLSLNSPRKALVGEVVEDLVHGPNPFDLLAHVHNRRCCNLKLSVLGDSNYVAACQQIDSRAIW